MEEKKTWNVTFMSHRSEIIVARTEEKAIMIAAGHAEPGETLSGIEEEEEKLCE